MREKKEQESLFEEAKQAAMVSEAMEDDEAAVVIAGEEGQMLEQDYDSEFITQVS